MTLKNDLLQKVSRFYLLFVSDVIYLNQVKGI
jgi:hypothetical protein